MPKVKPDAWAMRAAQGIYDVYGDVDLDQWAVIIQEAGDELNAKCKQAEADITDLREALVAADYWLDVAVPSEHSANRGKVNKVRNNIQAVLARTVPHHEGSLAEVSGTYDPRAHQSQRDPSPTEPSEADALRVSLDVHRQAAAQSIVDLREALAGLLALSEKMFDLHQRAVDRGVASFRPPDMTFDKLKSVVMSRAVLARTEPKSHDSE